MTTTKLEGWTEAEYKAWSEKHPDEARTIERNRIHCDAVRMDFDSTNPKIVGYASVFNTTAEIWPGFNERVAQGAFSKTIKDDDVRALWNHEPNYVLGRTKSGTLSLREDAKGLWYEIMPPDTSVARDLAVLIKRGDVSQSSFGFNIVEQTLSHDRKNDIVTRTLTEVKLFDVSPVTFPAYESTEVHVRTRKEGNASDEREVIVAENESPQQTDEELLRRFAEFRKSLNEP